MKILVLSVFALTVVVLSANAQTPYQAPATATASIAIITPITITKAVDMDFGSVATSSTSSTISLTATDGNLTPTIIGTASAVSVSTHTAAKFNVTGLANTAFAINFPLTTIDVSDIGSHGGAVMHLDLICSGVGTGANYTSSLSDLGTKDIYVGGTLTIAGNQAASTYQGTITVNVNYN